MLSLKFIVSALSDSHIFTSHKFYRFILGDDDRLISDGRTDRCAAFMRCFFDEHHFYSDPLFCNKINIFLGRDALLAQFVLLG